jgi:hypothetical protein
LFQKLRFRKEINGRIESTPGFWGIPHNKSHYRLYLEGNIRLSLDFSNVEHDPNNNFPVTSVTLNEDVTG